MTDVLQVVIYGLVLGSVIALGAMGVSLLYGILRFAHFAHGDLMTLGAYLALPAVTRLGLPVPLAMLVGMGGTVGVALLVDRALYRPLRRAAPVILLIASVGVALAVRSVVQLVWGPAIQTYYQGIQFPYLWLGLRVKPTWLVIAGTAAALAVLAHLFLTRTRLGKAMRAMADNPDLARVTGIETERVVAWTWVMGGGLAAGAGVLLGLDTRLLPTMGWNLLLPVFAGAILGGLGSPYGALAGGLVIGVAQELSTLALPAAYKTAVSFVVMILLLLLRPAGLFGGKPGWS